MPKWIYVLLLISGPSLNAQIKDPTSVMGKCEMLLSLIEGSFSYDTLLFQKYGMIRTFVKFPYDLSKRSLEVAKKNIFQAVWDFVVADSTTTYKGACVFILKSQDTGIADHLMAYFRKDVPFDKKKERYTIYEKILNYRDISGVDIRYERGKKDTSFIQFVVPDAAKDSILALHQKVRQFSQYMRTYILRNRERESKFVIYDLRTESGERISQMLDVIKKPNSRRTKS